MAQVTIYLDSKIEDKLKKAAKSSKLSVSKWVAKIIEEKVTTQWSPEVVDLAGSWQDDFPALETIRADIQCNSRREEL
ncbi:MAG: CopG family transcriptional regulator [Deltaproteobacteria bacterium]|nr:MAG: CopG family transcriptional regulator [Deltaproteobacteria bacterium]